MKQVHSLNFHFIIFHAKFHRSVDVHSQLIQNVALANVTQSVTLPAQLGG